MADTFEVGEVAILWRPISPNHGKQVVIKGPLVYHRWHDYVIGIDDEGMAYLITIPEDPVTDRCAEPHELRKLPPPSQKREQLGEWELCPWQPTHSTVECGGK